MDFQDELSSLNEWHFFREFTYSKNKFRPIPSEEVELADSIIWVGDVLAVYQVKEREAQRHATAQTEARWFEKKVLRKATKQVRDTLNYLNGAGTIEIQNHRGHTFALDIRSIRQLHKLVVYLPHDALPKTCRNIKHHRSRTAGMVHIIQASDYLGIIKTLLTPAEITDYLDFRETLIDKWEIEIDAVPEPAIVGQYVSGDIDAPPSVKFIEYIQRLDHQADEWDMSGIISQFSERITKNNETDDYYKIIRELALLMRHELREFKKRFQLSIEKARANELLAPYRMASLRTNCGFVFIAVTKNLLSRRSNGLRNFTLANKYELKLQKCIGVSIADDTDGWFTAEWCYADFPWEQDECLEKFLQDKNPFLEVKHVNLPQYAYRDDEA